MSRYTALVARRKRPLWGDNIKRILEASGVTATEIAAKAEMTVQQFSNLTNDSELNPQIRQLQRIAEALGVELAELFASTPTQTPEATHAPPRERSSDPVPSSAELRSLIRDVFIEAFTGALVGLGNAAGASDGPDPSPRVEETKDGDVSARPRRKIS